MSLIACTSNCVYQQDGCCTLERAASCGFPDKQSPCVNFIPRRLTVSNNGSQSLTDVMYLDKL